MKKTIIVSMVLLVILNLITLSYIFLSEDAPVQEVVCNENYMQVGTDCCLDLDSNDICDEDEVVNQPPQIIIQEPQETEEDNEQQEPQETPTQTKRVEIEKKLEPKWVRQGKHTDLMIYEINTEVVETRRGNIVMEELMLRSITVGLRNKDLDYITPRFEIQIRDSVETVFNKEFGELNSHFYTTEGWEQIPLGEERTYELKIDEKMIRPTIEKKLEITAETPYHRDNPTETRLTVRNMLEGKDLPQLGTR